MSARTPIGALAVALVVLGAVDSVAAQVQGSSPWPPQKYRFTGWMSAGVGDTPHHAFVDGDAVVFTSRTRGTIDRPATASAGRASTG